MSLTSPARFSTTTLKALKDADPTQLVDDFRKLSDGYGKAGFHAAP